LTSGSSGGIADRIDLDHRAARVAARRHEGTFERPERMALAAHQFAKDLGDMARLARRHRYVVGHCTSPMIDTGCRRLTGMIP